jgi:ribosomal protein L11 methyltransferase
LPPSKLKVSFLLPKASAELAGQALLEYFPDGLLMQDRNPSQVEFSGWPSRSDPPSLAQLKAALAGLGARRLRQSRSRPRDWVREYKSRFPMQTLGRFVILPEWRKKTALAPGKLPIVLLPGQAFGTGLHESTQLMLKSIAAIPTGARVLDIGAGSGILGLGCLRLGWQKVLAVEIEEAACGEMEGNRALNGFGPDRFAVRRGAFPKAMRGRPAGAALVLANLVTPLLCELMGGIAAQGAAGATFLFSGIHTEEEARKVAAAARAAGLRAGMRLNKKEWWCLRASK